ncbi:MAG TPA: ABC transporter substrate-binding protein [Mycobacteriales bacterium]|nr:ABC transporter substrate-binding protein [Mycobacteriales bacterium]
MRAARSRSSRGVLVVGAAGLLLLTSSGCSARFDRPPPGQEALGQDGLPPDQGGLPVVPEGQQGQGTTGALGTTGGTGALPGTTGAQSGTGTTGTTGGAATSGGTTGSGTSGSSSGSVPAGVTTGINGSTITVGLFVPKTGAAPVPPTVDAQVQNYFNYVKSKGGIWGRNVKVNIYDTGSTEAGARSAVQQAQSDKIFIGVSLDRLTVAAALVTALHNAGIPHLVTQLPPNAQVPDDAFVIGMDQLKHGPQIADYMAHSLKVHKVGIVTETDPGLYAARDAFINEAKAQGLQVVHSEAVDPSANQYLAEAQKLKNDGAEAVWLYMAPSVAINVAKESQSINYHPTWVGNSISWGFNLVLTPASGALNGARAFSPWGGLDDPRYAVFRKVNTAGRTPRDKDIGLAAWGFGQIVAGALKSVGPQLGRTSFLYAMQHLRLTNKDVVTGVPLCWSPLDFNGGKRFGSGNRTIVLRVKGSGGSSTWATESDYRAVF